MHKNKRNSFTPKRKRICSRALYCIVPTCNSNSLDDDNYVFHKFPKSTVRKAEWANALEIDPETITSHSRVCSMHFMPEDYFDDEANRKLHPRYGVRQHILKQSAIPTQHGQLVGPVTACYMSGVDNGQATANAGVTTNKMSPEEFVIQPQQSKEERYHVKYIKLGSLAPKNKKYEISVSYDKYTENDYVSKETNEVTPLSQSNNNNNNFLCGLDMDDEKKRFNVTDFVTSDKTLHQLTGILNFGLFNTLVDLLKEKKPFIRTGSLKHEARLLLTFMRLRLNLSFTFLSILFCIAKTTCKNVYQDTLLDLDVILDGAVAWPSQEEVRSNLPKCFAKFPRVRVVLDCTEIKTTRAKCLFCRCKLHSHYKGCYTLKFLLGVSPAGLFTYVSDCFGGRASDKHIFATSGLLEKLEQYQDDVMVDKGFRIQSECEANNIGVVQPPFLTKKRNQLSRSDALSNVTISQARVHVERAIGKVKQYKILTDALPFNQANLAETIMKVCCGMVNLSNPILADDKFSDDVDD